MSTWILPPSPGLSEFLWFIRSWGLGTGGLFPPRVGRGDCWARSRHACMWVGSMRGAAQGGCGCDAVRSRLHGTWIEGARCFLTCGLTRVGAACGKCRVGACGICRRRLAAQGWQPHECTGASLVAGATYHGPRHNARVDADAVSNGPVGYDAGHNADALLAQHALSGAAGDDVARVMCSGRMAPGCAAPASWLRCIAGL